MGWIKRNWLPHEAEEWTKEDLIACILSPLIYIAVAVGVVLILLFKWIGVIVLLGGILMLVLMIYVIDPKLRAISQDYEGKQKAYLEELEKIIRWEEE